jgi:predicted outer membrane repeat protein
MVGRAGFPVSIAARSIGYLTAPKGLTTEVIMHRMVIALLAIFTVISSVTAVANIINIPDDYPTIQQGIDATSDGDTVLVQPATYLENIDFHGRNVTLGSLYLTTGDTAYISQTFINGDASGSAVTFQSGEDSSALITGFTITNGYASLGGGIYCLASNPIIINNIIAGNEVFYAQGGAGGGIYVSFGSPLIEKNVISGNYASGPLGGFGGGIYCGGDIPIIKDNLIEQNTGDGYGGAIYCEGSGAFISGNTITDNTGTFLGGGIYCKQSMATIVNNIIVENYARWGDGGGIYCEEASPAVINNVLFQNEAGSSGGGIYCEMVSNPVLVNCIFWYNEAYEQEEIDIDDSSSPLVSYCNVPGGWGGEGNVDVDPLFRDAWNGDFYLMSTECGDSQDSPCIDAGHPDIADSLLDCSWGHGELASDMGAYGGADSATVAIDDPSDELPQRFILLQNYPNPFNASTSIRYVLPVASNVRIEIFDILGRNVVTLLEERQKAGYHQIVWNSEDQSSGLYFCRIVAGDFVSTKTMTLLK